jgi:transcriptional regulator with XRE-family HTH domain
MGVGTNLKRLRTKTKFSQQDIADKLNIDRVTYSNWENETFDVKSQYIPQLAEIFEVELHELFKNDQQIQIINNIENKDKAGGVGVQKGNIVINIINVSDENSASKLKEELEKFLNQK